MICRIGGAAVFVGGGGNAEIAVVLVERVLIAYLALYPSGGDKVNVVFQAELNDLGFVGKVIKR